MRHLPPIGRQPRLRRPGFSLVLSLTIMAMLLILCLGAAALLSVELRIAQASVAFAKARLNAISSARVALGTLQAYAGPDKRITANAALLDTAPDTPLNADGVNAPRLLGVWHGESVSSDYSKSHDDAFVGWLASGVTLAGATRGPATLAYPKNAKLDASGAIRLYREPSPQPAGAQGLTSLDDPAVYVAPEAVADNAGSIAWWIADDNQKADVSLRLPDASKLTPMQQAQNASLYGLKLNGDGDFAKFPESLEFNPALLDRGALPLESSGSGSWLADSRHFYHDITLRSSSLLTDVVNGGFKYDLSLLLAMDSLPDEYRGDTGYMAMEGHSDAPAKSALTARKAGWITKDIETALKPLFADPACQANRDSEWTCWGDLWNYARLYRHPDFDKSAGMTINSEPESNGRGTGVSAIDPTGNVSDKQNLSPWREPVITQFQLMFGLETRPSATPGKYDLHTRLRPYLQLWNPYDVPLRLSRAAVAGTADNFLCFSIGKLPGNFAITVTDSAGTKSYKKDWAGLYGNPTTFFDPYVDFNQPSSAGITLAPGEVRVFSPQAGWAGTGVDVPMAPGIRPIWNYTAKASGISPMDADAVVTFQFAPDAGTGKKDTANYFFVGISRRRPGEAGAPGQVHTWNGGFIPSVTTMDPFPSRTVDSTRSQLSAGRSLTLMTFRLRTETMAKQKFPCFSYGDYRRMFYNVQGANPNAAQNPDVFFSPYEVVQTTIGSEEELNNSTNPVMQSEGTRGFAFTGYTAGTGATAMVREHIPLAPPGSLGDLRHAHLGGGVANTRKLIRDGSRFGHPPPGFCVVQDAFANSFAHPMISRNMIAAPANMASFPGENVTGNSYPFTFFDFSWIMNADLWDSWCVTGLCAQDSPINAFNPSGAPKSIDEVATGFFEKDKPLANTRLRLENYGASGTAMHALVVASGKPVADGYTKSAAMMSVDGGFNINSTSVRAWRALLGGLNTARLPVVGQSTTLAADSLQTKSGDNPVLRAPIQSAGVLADANTGSYSKAFNDQRTVAGRKLTDDQLTKLAQQIVTQVKKRGPFLSLGEFMNRRLEDSDLGDKGALQAAIDASGVNNFAKSTPALQVTAGDVGALIPALKNPDAVIGPMGRGLPGYVTQADLVSPVATALTPRGDTFTIRAYGSSEEGATAAVEIVVRRTTAFMDTANDVFTFPDNRSGSFKTTNKVFGRRFVVLASRWMTNDEI